MLPLDPFLYDFLDGVEWRYNIQINLFVIVSRVSVFVIWIFGCVDLFGWKIFHFGNLPKNVPTDDPRLEKGQKGEASGGVFGAPEIWGIPGRCLRKEFGLWELSMKSQSKKSKGAMCFFSTSWVKFPRIFWNVLFEMIHLRRFLIAKMCEILLDWGIRSRRRIFEEDISDARLLFSKLPANMPSLPSTFSNPTFPKDSQSLQWIQ